MVAARRNRDRLSSLPDELLLVVVSFLPFKEAVRTSLLSRRWRFIPLETRCLEFNETDFVPEPGVPHVVLAQQRRDFLSFLVRWIRNSCGSYVGKSDLDKFLLSFSDPQKHLPQMQECIKFAMDHNVRVLELDFSDPRWEEEEEEDSVSYYPKPNPFLKLPFNANKGRLVVDADGPVKNSGIISALQSVKLISCFVPEMFSGDYSFSGLRSVSLGRITVNSFCIKKLAEKCPLMEDLSMWKCCYAGHGYFEIMGAESLKRLIVEMCYSDKPDGTLQLLIDAPNLRVFKYSGVLCGFEFERLSLDMEASIDFGLQREHVEYGDILYESLVHIGGVHTLTVCSYMLQVITSGEEPYELKPQLGRLRHLILKASLHADEFFGIQFFLKSCPNLEVLTIDLTTHARIFPEYEPPLDMEQHAFVMKRHSVAYPCVKKTLKSVVVNGFKGTRNEKLLLKHVLRYGRVLESLHINISKERAPNGRSMEHAYVKRAHALFKFNTANPAIRIFLSRANAKSIRS